MTEKATPLELKVVTDNSSEFSSVPVSAEDREPSGRLEFGYVPATGRKSAYYEVRASGPIFGPEPARQGALNLSRSDAIGAIDSCRDAWRRHVVEKRSVRPDGKPDFLFYDREWDLSGTKYAGLLDSVAPELARAGQSLFSNIFRQGDEGLTQIADLLEAALREGPTILAIQSDSLFVPWWMLYTPPDPSLDLLAEGFRWSSPLWQGFWGYRHLIEHRLDRTEISTRIVRDGNVRVGLNVDPTIDAGLGVKFVEPVTSFFEKRCATTDSAIRTEKNVLARALSSKDFCDQIIYFGCHGTVSGPASKFATSAQLALGDNEPIRTSDFRGWLPEPRRLTSNPFVFINACQGGQMSSLFYTAFGPPLLGKGANCILGPQIDVPAVFAVEYAMRLFGRFLRPETRLGDVVQQLNRSFIDDHQNPLGLIFSLYRGLDTRLVEAR
jgi:hypothetical protein